MLKSCETCSKDEISKMISTGVEENKSEIRLKSENLQPCSFNGRMCNENAGLSLVTL